jgi:pSer/pThr/pTyr-binding forkhead associated (FHA) protein
MFHGDLSVGKTARGDLPSGTGADMSEPKRTAQGMVTFQVLEGIDKGRIFRELSTPVTVGREEGNLLRLNDERVSRFHAKVQLDDSDYILTDLESTNGTRVNGAVVQIRRLRFGDRVGVGRSVLLFGSNEQIASRMASLTTTGAQQPLTNLSTGSNPEPGCTVQPQTLAGQVDPNIDFDLNLIEPAQSTRDALFIGNKQLPPMPLKLAPSQAARLAEILDFLHQGITQATENIQARDDGTQVGLPFVEWQRVLAVQMLLARYLRMISEPPEETT